MCHCGKLWEAGQGLCGPKTIAELWVVGWQIKELEAELAALQGSLQKVAIERDGGRAQTEAVWCRRRMGWA